MQCIIVLIERYVSSISPISVSNNIEVIHKIKDFTPKILVYHDLKEDIFTKGPLLAKTYKITMEPFLEDLKVKM